MRHFASRLAQAVIVIFGVTTALFVLLRAVPGNPAAVVAGQNATPATVAALEAQYGLNRPVLDQYGHWIANIVTGHLGTSVIYDRSVGSLIGQNLDPSLQLLVAALVLGVLLGGVLGVVSAAHRGGLVDTVVTGAISIFLGTPGFWVGVLLLLVFSVHLHWVPSGGWANVFSDPAQGFRTLALPAVTLALGVASVQARFMRAAMLEALDGDYVRTARAKGASDRRVLWRHALRNALVPVVTITGLQAGILLGGVVIIENVFARPGLGSLIAQAVANRDYPLVQGVTLVLVGVFSALNLLVDLLYAAIDPRIRR